MVSNDVRVRFAPSPTGMLHIGGARTAIYNWAFARSCNGSFILRIEDTDPERSTEENTQIILNALRWLDLNWDEGPEVGGEVGPYFQTGRAANYEKYLQKLKDVDAVYPCFCTKEQLAADREAANESEGGYSGYCGRCRTIPKSEALERIESGESHVWRLKIPESHPPIVFEDAVFGRCEFPSEVMDDLVLVRADSTPTYNFANVCDDVDMRISHVIRGDDHLSNTPRQLLIYEALNQPAPVFAHLPMILGSDGKKLSKRHGATSVEEYRDRGYLPEAIVNYLALLGWSVDGETTVISPSNICECFSLERINKKDAVFDEEKLDWLNGVYIRNLDRQSWFDAALPWLAQALVDGRAINGKVELKDTPTKDELKELAKQVPPAGSGVLPEEWESALQKIKNDKSLYIKTFDLIVERMVRFNEIPAKLSFLFWGEGAALEKKSVDKVLLKEGARADEAIEICLGVLEDTSVEWECDALQDRCRLLGESAGFKLKNLFQPLRVAVTGNMVSPPLFESIELMSRLDVTSRVRAVFSTVFKRECKND